MDGIGAVPAFSPFSANEPEPTDYVKWQGSQTACPALNQLIKSSADEPNIPEEGVSTSRGWQRQPSFDQIPGFSLLSTNDSTSSPFLKSNPHSSSSSSKSSFSRPPSRPRPSGSRPRSPAIPPDVTNLDLPLSMPLLNKTNPAQFMDMLKGVSARLDENAGVRPRNGGSSSIGPTRATRATKRARGASLGGIAELQAGRVKKGRVSVLRETDWDEGRNRIDKGKGRAMPEDGERDGRRLSANADGRMLDASSYLGPHVASSLRSSEDGSFMDIDGNTTKSSSRSRSQCWADSPDHSSSTKSPSQTRMPPPPAPRTKHPGEQRPRINTPMTSTAASPSSNFSHIQQSHSLQQKQPNPTESKPPKPDPVPKLHPLLLEPSAKASSSSVSRPQPQPQARIPPRAAPAPLKPQPALVVPKIEPTSTSKPQQLYPQSKAQTTSVAHPSLTQNLLSSRPPALGMRRTHTFPASGITTSLQKTGALPTRQKGFKPPLLSASQPQSQAVQAPSQARIPPQAQLQPKLASSGVSTRSGGGQPQPKYDSPRGPAGSNGSTSSDSQRAPTSSSGSSAPGSASSKSTSTSVSPATASKSISSKPRVPAAPSAPAPIPVSAPLPEPSDGDPDSSFGDMSFDMDALEETMRMYD